MNYRNLELIFLLKIAFFYRIGSSNEGEKTHIDFYLKLGFFYEAIKSTVSQRPGRVPVPGIELFLKLQNVPNSS